MKEKDYKQIATLFDYNEKEKQEFLDAITTIETFIKKNLEKGKLNNIQLAYSSWPMFLVYDDNKEMELYLYIDSSPLIINNINQYLMNTLENLLLINNIDTLDRSNNQLIFNYLSYKIIINLVDIHQFKAIKEKQLTIKEAYKNYSLLSNAFRILRKTIVDNNIKQIDPLVLYELFMNKVSYSAISNKYYQYIDIFIKAIDELNNKKTTINYFYQDILVTDLLSEAKINEYKKLRKVLASINKIENEEIKYDSLKELIIDVNPKLLGDTILWHFEILNRDIANEGGNYSNNLENYQSAILKGVFKALSKICEYPNLINKNIYLLCDHPSILGDTMLSNEENKSRMKTIKALINNNNLKVSQKENFK